MKVVRVILPSKKIVISSLDDMVDVTPRRYSQMIVVHAAVKILRVHIRMGSRRWRERHGRGSMN